MASDRTPDPELVAKLARARVVHHSPAPRPETAEVPVDVLEACAEAAYRVEWPNSKSLWDDPRGSERRERYRKVARAVLAAARPRAASPAAEPLICSVCNGSGEGSTPNTICGQCGGRGGDTGSSNNASDSPAAPDAGVWSVGQNRLSAEGTHVYVDDRHLGTFHDRSVAEQAVRAVNELASLRAQLAEVEKNRREAQYEFTAALAEKDKRIGRYSADLTNAENTIAARNARIAELEAGLRPLADLWRSDQSPARWEVPYSVIQGAAALLSAAEKGSG